MEKKDFQIKGFKKMIARDGYAFQCAVTVKGKKAFAVHNSGDGGPNRYDVTNQTLFEEAKAFAATLYSDAYSPLDLLVEDLINEQEILKQLKKICKKETVFYLPDSPQDYKTVKAPYDARVKSYINSKYPTAVIVNKTLA